MSMISIEAKLSQRYTNHSIRATVINQLRDKGFRKEQICKITGHKNPRGLESYFRKRCPDKEISAMNESLQNSLHDIGNASTKEDLYINVDPSPMSQISDTVASTSTDNAQIIQFSNHQNFMIARAPSNKKWKVTCNGETNVIAIEFQ